MGVKGSNISYKYRAWFMVYDSYVNCSEEHPIPKCIASI
jgi:hypothetical protein